MRIKRLVAQIVSTSALLVAAMTAGATDQGGFDPSPVWPLCGRIAEQPPSGWMVTDGCPESRWGNPSFTDAPLASTFGPRQLASEGFRYDFHRGIDIPTPLGTPVFAFADGIVRKAGLDPAYSDPLVQLRHYRPGHSGQCTGGGGCYHTNYLHMSSVAVTSGDDIHKGDVIGYSGASQSGFEHVHFEVRDAPAQDAFSSWQRDAIHPLKVLPYHDGGASNIALALDHVDRSDPLRPTVHVTVTIPMSVELDLEGAEIEVYERQLDGSLLYVTQPGETPVGTTPEGVGYWVEPPWYSMNTWNRQYTYKDSSSIPWSAFQQGGMYESPYEEVLPGTYDPNVHLDAQEPSDSQIGLFNGMSFAPDHTNAASSEYVLRLGFLALTGTTDAANLCVQVRVSDVHGNASPWLADNCVPLPVPLLSPFGIALLSSLLGLASWRRLRA